MNNIVKLLAWEHGETQYPRKFMVKHAYGSPSFWNPRSILAGEPFLRQIYKTEILRFKQKEG